MSWRLAMGGQPAKSSDGTKIGSSTDPQIIASLLPSSPTPDAAVVTTTSPVSGIDLKSNPASIVLPATNLNDFVPVAQVEPRRRPSQPRRSVSSVAASGSWHRRERQWRSQCRSCRHADCDLSEAVTVAGGTPTLAVEQWWNRKLRRRLRNRYADLQLYGCGRARHRATLPFPLSVSTGRRFRAPRATTPICPAS